MERERERYCESREQEWGGGVEIRQCFRTTTKRKRRVGIDESLCPFGIDIISNVIDMNITTHNFDVDVIINIL